MSTELFTIDGKRKYLTASEQDSFLDSASKLDRAEVRTFCMTMAYTGCRISEALQLTADRVDLANKAIVYRTLKQRDKLRYRSVPTPDELLEALELVHRVRKLQKRKDHSKNVYLWPWGRTQATKFIWSVMADAGISGQPASPKGLRHAFGARMMAATRNPRLVMKWMGHTKLENTMIYLDLIGEEERAVAVGAWQWSLPITRTVKAWLDRTSNKGVRLGKKPLSPSAINEKQGITTWPVTSLNRKSSSTLLQSEKVPQSQTNQKNENQAGNALE